MKKQMRRILSLVIVLCLLVSANVVYAGEFDSETITINGESYTVVVQENDFSRIVSMYDSENNLVEKYSFQKNENKIVNLLSGDSVQGEKTNNNRLRSMAADDGYYYYGTYTYPFGAIASVASLIAALLASGFPIAVASEIAAAAGNASLITGAVGVSGMALEVIVDEYGKVDSLYQYSKRIANAYEKISGNNRHIAGPSEWLRKTSINS